METYLEKDVSNTALGRLTPEKAGYALLVELNLLRKDDSVFGRFVYERLTNLRVGDTDYVLNLHDCVLEFVELCKNFETAEFAIPTFGSLYRTRDGAFDPNYDLFHHEVVLLVDGANFAQLLKAFITLLQAMHKRFYMTADPTCTDMSRAVYFVKDGDVKHERRTAMFCDFLARFQRVYTRFCMISPSKQEVRAIYGEASAAVKAHCEAMRQKKLKLSQTKKGKVKYYTQRQEQKAQALQRPVSQVTATAAADGACLPRGAVWGGQRTVPLPALEEAEVAAEPTVATASEPANAASESESSDGEGFTLVQRRPANPKPKPKPNPKRFQKKRT